MERNPLVYTVLSTADIWGRLAGLITRVPALVCRKGTIGPGGDRENLEMFFDRLLVRYTSCVIANSSVVGWASGSAYSKRDRGLVKAEILIIDIVCPWSSPRIAPSKILNEHMYFQYGYFKPLVARKVGGILTVRQVIPATFVLSLVGTGVLAPWSSYGGVLFGGIIVAYALTDVICSIFAGFQKGLMCGLTLPLVFPVLHLSYGLGFLMGSFEFLILRRGSRKDIARIPITR
jgi:hypothetical protein